MELYKEGFWNWCKENHPEILIEFYQETKYALEEVERWVKEIEKKRQVKKQ